MSRGQSKNELRYGRLRFVSFIILDLICLICANTIAVKINISRMNNYGFHEHFPAVIIMLVVDLIVTFAFNTLSLVLRRRKKKELIESIKHIGYSFFMLVVILFLLRSGNTFSRFVIFLAYAIDFLFITAMHVVWREWFIYMNRGVNKNTAFLMSTDRFVEEGLNELQEMGIDVKHILLLCNMNRGSIKGIPVVETPEEAASVICWNLIGKVYIYGLDHQMVPHYLIRVCNEMGLKFNLVDFNYRVIDVKTIKNEDPKYGALSFLEGKRDIPFPIRRVYWITETEAELHRGFHAHKLNCQLLYCPFGKIDIVLDDGEKRTTVTLDEPGKGLILMPGLWREMIWRQSGSVLCVLASEYYDAHEYIRNYDDFIAYSKKYREVAEVNMIS